MGVATLPLQAKAQLELRRRGIQLDTGWPSEYESKRTGIYRPQNNDVDTFIANDRPRYMLLKGGEGGGKTASGSVGVLRLDPFAPQFQKIPPVIEQVHGVRQEVPPLDKHGSRPELEDRPRVGR